MQDRKRLKLQLILSQGASLVAEEVIDLTELFNHFYVAYFTSFNVSYEKIRISHAGVGLDPKSVDYLLNLQSHLDVQGHDRVEHDPEREKHVQGAQRFRAVPFQIQILTHVLVVPIAIGKRK